MADTFPPSLLPPESAPWGRSIQEATVWNRSAVNDANIQVSNIEKVQAEQGRQIAIGLSDLNRDVNAVNEQLSRKYLELTAADRALGLRIDALTGRVTTLEGRMDSAFEYLSLFSALLADHGPRIGALETKLTFRTATSIDGLEFLADGGSGSIWKVPQSVGSPLGGPLKWPISLDKVTDEFGPRPSPGAGGSTDHKGMDFGGGGPIKAAGRGVVVMAGPNGGLGNWVKIRHSPTVETGYGHMAPGSPIVTVGQAVAQGQELGTMGTTGTSTGIHLHFEVHVNGIQVDPRSVINGTEVVS